MNLTRIHTDDPAYPAALRNDHGAQAPVILDALGNLELFGLPALALFCSVKCPGDLILQTYDLAQALRDAGVPVIGGFHSPMEKECLRLLLRGTQPVLVCPARTLEGMRLPGAWRQPLADGRLLLLSPFPAKCRRVTSAAAQTRNAALAAHIFVAHAAPDSKTEGFCRDLLARGRSLWVLPGSDNAHVLSLGARPVNSRSLPPEWHGRR